MKRHGDIIGQLELPCGVCIGCRLDRASDWQLRIIHESSLWPQNCFVTLTYGRGNLPANGSLDHRDVQLFLKRVRKGKGPLRFFNCGEYGPLNGRPHYHACLFNCDFRGDRVPAGKSASGELFYSSDELDSYWKFGRCSVQDLTPGTAGYCARYIMKKSLGVDAEGAYDFYDGENWVSRKPEYCCMSKKPGIGAGWYRRFKDTDVFPQDFVVSEGQKRPVPKYYDRLYKRESELDYGELVAEREFDAMKHREDQTVDRLKVREEVHLARVKSLSRSLE